MKYRAAIALLAITIVACTDGGSANTGATTPTADSNTTNNASSDADDDTEIILTEPEQNEALSFLNHVGDLELSSYGSVYGGTSMTRYRTQHRMTQMHDGRLLVSGGRSVSGLFGNYTYDNIETYDPVTQIWSLGINVAPRAYSTNMVALPNNKVLIGIGQSAEILDVDKQSVETISDSNCQSVISDNGFQSLLLADGRVLFTGPSGKEFNRAELYIPDEGSVGCFHQIANMQAERWGHTITQLRDGRVLLLGGSYQQGSAEWFDPATNSFTAIRASMLRQRMAHSAVQLRSGKVLIVGGYDIHDYVASAEIFDPETETFSGVSNEMQVARGVPLLMPIESGIHQGKVLIAGGYVADRLSGTSAIEVFDAETESFSTIGLIAPSLSSYGAMASLGDGRYAHTGGHYGHSGMIIIDTAHIAVFTLAAHGGKKPYTYSIASGAGEIDAKNGVVKLPPLAQTVTVKVTDADAIAVEQSITVHLTE